MERDVNGYDPKAGEMPYGDQRVETNSASEHSGEVVRADSSTGVRRTGRAMAQAEFRRKKGKRGNRLSDADGSIKTGDGRNGLWQRYVDSLQLN